MATATNKKASGKKQTPRRAPAKPARPAGRPATGSAARSAGAKTVTRAGKDKPKPAPEVEAPDRSAPPMAEIDADALEFIAAIDRFKKQHGRPFPSWSEILLVLRDLGYERR